MLLDRLHSVCCCSLPDITENVIYNTFDMNALPSNLTPMLSCSNFSVSMLFCTLSTLTPTPKEYKIALRKCGDKAYLGMANVFACDYRSVKCLTRLSPSRHTTLFQCCFNVILCLDVKQLFFNVEIATSNKP